MNAIPSSTGQKFVARESFADLFTPKLVTVLREGYGLADLRADALAGLTVAIVALPLSMAIAIASGATPQSGLFAAVVGGAFVSILGGSRFQIGGPAGAFIVLVASTIEQHGYSGFLAATIMAGVFLLLIGYLRLGTYIKYIPHSVAVGFTASIGLIISPASCMNRSGSTWRANRRPSRQRSRFCGRRAKRSILTPSACGGPVSP